MAITEAGVQPGSVAADPKRGLTGAEAAARLARDGPNELGRAKRLALVAQIGRLFANPLVTILLIASAVSASLGERLSAAIIVAIVVISAVLNFLQTFHSQRAADRLRAQVAPTATVLRDGAWKEIPRREIVRGDVVRLSAGDLVPADAQILESDALHVQQAALTGESMPVEKTASANGAPPSATHPDSPDRLFLGTSVTSGSATALITATGPATSFGEIAARLATRPPETDFERGMRELSALITRSVFFLVLFVFLVSAAFHKPALDSLLFAIALAVGLTPEFLPMITTVTLGQGAIRMARRHVIVKHLEAIENLGSMDILCSDKTGTLTTGDMRMEAAVDTAGQPSERTRQLACLNSRFETGIRNPLDDAILAACKQEDGGYAKVAEIPFDFERRRLSVVAQMGGDGGERLLISKGAPESILAVCDSWERDGEQVPLTETERAGCISTYRGFSASGFRVLAVAAKQVPPKDRYTADDESGMSLTGFVTFVNPPLPDADNLLHRLAKDGVHVKLITGDNELVTRHLCETVGLDASRIVLGDEMETMTDSALGQVAEQVSVFARVSPAQKNRIIAALKRRGHVVGYMGDGINDAPSLHTADVGISVATAVDVAKEAAEIILMQPGLHVLHNGILEGRKAFGNVMKYLLMNISSNFGNMVSMAGASLFLPFLPMLPPQILLNNFLYDVSQITIPTDRVDPEMIRKPRHWDMRLIRSFMMLIGPISSIYDFLTFWVLLSVFHASQAEFHTGWFVESLATQTLVIFVIRTARNPLRSKPSRPLVATMLAAVGVAAVLPYTPLAAPLGFTPLPPLFFAFLVAATATYLLLVEAAKRVLFKRVMG